MSAGELSFTVFVPTCHSSDGTRAEGTSCIDAMVAGHDEVHGDGGGAAGRDGDQRADHPGGPIGPVDGQ